MTRVDLLVLEDFGMKKLGRAAAEDLLEVFVRRHETAATLITTNRPTQDRVTSHEDVFPLLATIVLAMSGKAARSAAYGPAQLRRWRRCNATPTTNRSEARQSDRHQSDRRRFWRHRDARRTEGHLYGRVGAEPDR